MPRLKFGAFLAPHHPIGEHPMLQFRRDLDLVEHLDKLGYEEFWCGEHHSSGWEMIASPEMFLAAAGERSRRIRLATGVVSLPYHHPFHVAQRMVQLDHMTGGRAIFGSGPGALASDAHTLGIDPMTQRDYYSLGAFFNSIDEYGLYADSAHVPTPSILLPNPEQEKAMGATAKELESKGQQLRQASDDAEPSFQEWLRGAKIDALSPGRQVTIDFHSLTLALQ